MDIEWDRVSAHAIAWQDWRISRASVRGESVYVLWHGPADGVRKMRGTYQEVEDAKSAAEMLAAAHVDVL